MTMTRMIMIMIMVMMMIMIMIMMMIMIMVMIMIMMMIIGFAGRSFEFPPNPRSESTCNQHARCLGCSRGRLR